MWKKIAVSVAEIVYSNRAVMTLVVNGVLWVLSKVGIVSITADQALEFLQWTMVALLGSYGFRAPGKQKDSKPSDVTNINLPAGASLRSKRVTNSPDGVVTEETVTG